MSLSNDVVILPGISNLELRFDGWCLSVPDHRLFNENYINFVMTLNLVLIIIELLLYYIYVQLILIECHKDRDTIVQNRQKSQRWLFYYCQVLIKGQFKSNTLINSVCMIIGIWACRPWGLVVSSYCALLLRHEFDVLQCTSGVL